MLFLQHQFTHTNRDVLDGHDPGSHFGAALASLGDINLDTYNGQMAIKKCTLSSLWLSLQILHMFWQCQYIIYYITILHPFCMCIALCFN